MNGVKYYRVGQFEEHPQVHEERTQFVEWLKNEAEEVDEDYEPYWGGGVWMVNPDDTIRLYKDNYDSSG